MRSIGRGCKVTWPLFVFVLSVHAQHYLPGTQLLDREGDIPLQMVRGIDRFLDRETQASIERRQTHWNRDYSSPEAYVRSVAPNRERFRTIIGLADKRVEFAGLVLDATTKRPSLVAAGPGYEVHSVRWPVLEDVEAEGLLLEPAGRPVANVIALPDADWAPEMLVGLAPGAPPAAQFARRLAENGCRVLVPVLIDRRDTWSGNPRVRLTNLPHREMIHRMAYQMGRHIIGFEVQKVLAAVDWFVQEDPDLRVGVIGYGEGGLLALYSAAADTRIDAAVVSGYFESREGLWREPLYRNVWALLHEFGDAELAGLVAPRVLVVEASRGPEVAGSPSPTERRRDAAAPKRLTTPTLREVRREVARAKPVFEKLAAGKNLSLIVSADGRGEPGSDAALAGFLQSLNVPSPLEPAGLAPRDQRGDYDPAPRQRRQFLQLVEFSQKLARESEFVRQKFWSKADASSPESWEQSLEPYRRHLWEEIIGKFRPASEPLKAQTRVIYDEPKWAGYEVVLPVWPDVFTYGILLVPKDIRAGERRPVVVCQHGVNRRVYYVVDPKLKNAYNNFAAKLADEGFG